MKTILIIEDELTVRESLIDLLEIEGFKAIAAENGKVGLRLAQEHNPDLVLCDISMPEMDGFGVLQSLREHPDTGAMPFIFLTARTTKIEFRRGMELGADDYLFKPFTVDELLSAISARLNKQAAMIQQFSSPVASVPTLPTIASQDGLLNYFYQELRNPLSTLNLILYWLKQNDKPSIQELINQQDYTRELSVLQQVYQLRGQLAPEALELLESCQLDRLSREPVTSVALI
jgi:two-component system, OmpR family, alkaline phosphatase synthesis response regulator PhoP